MLLLLLLHIAAATIIIGVNLSSYVLFPSGHKTVGKNSLKSRLVLYAHAFCIPYFILVHTYSFMRFQEGGVIVFHVCAS